VVVQVKDNHLFQFYQTLLEQRPTLFKQVIITSSMETLSRTGSTYLMNEKSGENTLSGGPLTEKYQLVQVDFHIPAEHTIDDKRYSLELHLVHYDSVGDRYGIIAVLFDISEKSTQTILTDLLDGIITLSSLNNKNSMNWIVRLEELSLFIKKSNDFYHYLGSETMPPCTEDTSWYILTQPLFITSTQLNYLHSFTGNNSRPLQSSEDRQVTHYMNASEETPVYLVFTVWSIIICFGVFTTFCYIYLRRRGLFNDSPTSALLDVTNPINSYHSKDESSSQSQGLLQTRG